MQRTIGVLIVALFLVLAMSGNAFAGGGRKGHKSGDQPKVTKDGDKTQKNELDKKELKKKKKKKHKRKHHHGLTC